MRSRDESDLTEAEGQSPPVCCHHWAIEPANGPFSQGVCHNCQEVREFKNSIEWQLKLRKTGASPSA